MDDDAVADQTSLGTSDDHPVGHVGTGDRACAWHLEEGPDLGLAENDLLLVRFELPDEHLLDVVEQLVDDAVGEDLDARLLGGATCLALGANVEADDDRTRHLGQGDVVLADPADRAMDDVDPTVLAFDLVE